MEKLARRRKGKKGTQKGSEVPRNESRIQVGTEETPSMEDDSKREKSVCREANPATVRRRAGRCRRVKIERATSNGGKESESEDRKGQ